jgi:hypothetical protein
MAPSSGDHNGPLAHFLPSYDGGRIVAIRGGFGAPSNLSLYLGVKRR